MNEKDPLIFLEHILESIQNIENFSKGLSEKSFMNDELRQSAIVRQIEIIGEAVKNLPDSLKNKYANVSWKEIVGTRDKMVHHYFGVDLDIVWDIVKKNLPRLKKDIKDILDKEK